MVNPTVTVAESPCEGCLKVGVAACIACVEAEEATLPNSLQPKPLNTCSPEAAP